MLDEELDLDEDPEIESVAEGDVAPAEAMDDLESDLDAAFGDLEFSDELEPGQEEPAAVETPSPEDMEAPVADEMEEAEALFAEDLEAETGEAELPPEIPEEDFSEAGGVFADEIDLEEEAFVEPVEESFASVSDEKIEETVRRVLEEVVERVVRETVSEVSERVVREVVSETAERVIGEAINALKESIDSSAR
jgi:hypothetical protein